jgi:hypothetical protein
MEAVSLVAAKPMTNWIGRRIGQFTIGAFAGICAAFVPRIMG